MYVCLFVAALGSQTRQVASRLSLAAFRRRGFFNTHGGERGVVYDVCGATNVMLCAVARRRNPSSATLHNPSQPI